MSARIAALEAALKPFADRADQHLEGAHWMDACFTVDDCRAARAAMEGKMTDSTDIEIQELRYRVSQLERALTPFVNMTYQDRFDAYVSAPDNAMMVAMGWAKEAGLVFNLGDLRFARDVLERNP